MVDYYFLQKIKNSYNFLDRSYSNRYMNWKKFLTISQSVEKLLPTDVSAPVKILDIGCSEGFLILLLDSVLEKKRSVEFTGIDLSPKGIEYAVERSNYFNRPNCFFKVMSAEKLDFPDSTFDIIISSEVIEHIPDPLQMLSGMNRVLKPSGSIILTTPNDGTTPLRWIIRAVDRLTFGKFSHHRKMFSEEYLERFPECARHGQTEENIGFGHVSVKDFKGWKALFSKAGFCLNRVRGTAGLVFGDPTIDKHRIIFAFLIVLDTALDHLPFSHFWCEGLQFELKKEQP